MFGIGVGMIFILAPFEIIKERQERRQAAQIEGYIKTLENGSTTKERTSAVDKLASIGGRRLKELGLLEIVIEKAKKRAGVSDHWWEIANMEALIHWLESDVGEAPPRSFTRSSKPEKM
jgi:hypothetical protein